MCHTMWALIFFSGVFIGIKKGYEHPTYIPLLGMASFIFKSCVQVLLSSVAGIGAHTALQ